MSESEENQLGLDNLDNKSQGNEELNELRSLLLGLEKPKLQKFYARLENPHQIQPEDISSVLPEAVILRTMQDKQLTEAIVPTVEQAVQTSVQKDLQVLSDAMFPIIGPATRKAIATTLEGMLQSLEYTLEHSLSPQSIKWRIEARQTGKSFAEVVLLRTLIYRVEQVFLIHKETGLLLQHVVPPKIAAQDPDLVSAMLTAIEDFIKDSFNVRSNQALASLEFGDLTIWIEEGPIAVLAGIIRGNAPQELRIVFQDAIEKIHHVLDQPLQSFDGDTEPFTASKPYLEACLESQYKTQTDHKKNYTYALSLCGIVTLVLGIWGFLAFRSQMRWNAYVNMLKSQPGIVVVESYERRGKYYLRGMRDPLAVNPDVVSQGVNIDSKKVIASWQPYQSLEPEFIVKRAKKLLRSPDTVSFTIDKNGTLYATGTAPSKWIAQSRNLALFIPGVSGYVDKNLANLNASQLQSYKQQVEQEMLFFANATTDLLPGEEKKLQNMVLKIQKLLTAAQHLGKNIKIKILGHTDKKGTEEINMQLSKARAAKVFSYLTSQGIKENYLQIVPVGFQKPLNTIKPSEETLRRVTFQVVLNTDK